MTLQYRNLLSSMESEDELDSMLDDEKEEGTPDDGDDGETKDDDTDVEVTVEGDGDVTVETGEEEESEETSEETSEEETGEEETETPGEEEESSDEKTEEEEDAAASDDTETPEEDVAGGKEESDKGEEEDETPDEDGEEGGEEADEEGGQDAASDDDDDGEPEIEPPSDEGDDDEAAAELGEIEENVGEAEGELEENEDTTDQLEDVADELEEAQDALEAMAAADDVPAYAEKMFMDKLAHISRRTGAQFRMVSSESHQGSNFKDYVFVDSLESSLKDTAKQVGEAIMRLIRQALDAAQRIWSMLTDATRRINARAKKAKEALKGMDFNREFAQERAKVLVEKHKNAISYVTTEVSGEKLGFNERLVGELKKYEENYNKIFEVDFEFGKNVIRMLKGEPGVDVDWDKAEEALKEAGAGETKRAMMAFMYFIAQDLQKATELTHALPGGQIMTANKVISKLARGKKTREEMLASDEAMASGLADFAQRKGALEDLAGFVIDLTEPSAKFTKEFEKTQRQWFREMEKAASGAAEEHADKANEEKERGAVKGALDKFGASALASAAVRVCYSSSKEARKAWIKTLHGCNVILAGYASGKAVKEDSKEQAEAA